MNLLILGRGTSGLDVARWALAHPERVSSITLYGGAQSGPTLETLELERAGVTCVFGTEDVEGSYDVCVASPGISEFSPFFASARAHATQVMGEPEFAWRLSPERWIGITGTNGKTTTTALTAHLLESAGIDAEPVGNIGYTPTSRVDHRAPDGWFVAELSSYQLATTEELHPRVGVLLNITPDHLSWHRSHEAYARAKCRLFRNMGPAISRSWTWRTRALSRCSRSLRKGIGACSRSALPMPAARTQPLCATACSRCALRGWRPLSCGPTSSRSRVPITG